MKSVNIISSLMYPISTHRRKLGRLKRENREDTYIGGRGSARTEASPEAQQIYDELILALLDEFRKIRENLPHLGKKHIKDKPGLYNNLCRIVETLISLLETKPEKTSIKQCMPR